MTNSIYALIKLYKQKLRINGNLFGRIVIRKYHVLESDSERSIVARLVLCITHINSDVVFSSRKQATYIMVLKLAYVYIVVLCLALSKNNRSQ
jgi:hypothetical protein